MIMMVVILSREMKGWTFARQLSWPSTLSATTRCAARTSPSRCSSTCNGAQLVALLATQSGSRWRKPPQPSGSFCWGASWGPTRPGSSSSPASWPSGWAWRPSPFSATLCRPTSLCGAGPCSAGWRWTASSRSTCTSSRARRCATSACGSCRTCTSTRCSACCRSTCGARRSSWSSGSGSASSSSATSTATSTGSASSSFPTTAAPSSASTWPSSTRPWRKPARKASRTSPRTSSTTTASSCWGCWRCRQETASPTWWCAICGTSTTRDKEKVPPKVPLWPAPTNPDHRKNDEGWFWMLVRSPHTPVPSLWPPRLWLKLRKEFAKWLVHHSVDLPRPPDDKVCHFMSC